MIQTLSLSLLTNIKRGNRSARPVVDLGELASEALRVFGFGKSNLQQFYQLPVSIFVTNPNIHKN